MSNTQYTPVKDGEQQSNAWIEDRTFDVEFQVVTPVTIQQTEQQQTRKDFTFQEVIPYSLHAEAQVFFVERTSVETVTIVMEELLGHTENNYRVVRRRRSKVTKKSRQVFLVNVDSKGLLRMSRRTDAGFLKKKLRRDSCMSL